MHDESLEDSDLKKDSGVTIELHNSAVKKLTSIDLSTDYNKENWFSEALGQNFNA
jgi:hypothetical protein